MALFGQLPLGRLTFGESSWLPREAYFNLREDVVEEVVDLIVGADQEGEAVLLLPGERLCNQMFKLTD